MSLKEQIDKISEEEKTLSEAVVDSEEVIEEPQEEVKEEPKDEPIEKEEPKEEPKEPVKEEHKPSNQEWAEVRRMAKIAEDEKRKREELEVRIKEYESKKEVEPVKDLDVEPNKDEDLAGWLEWKSRKVEQFAKQAEDKAEQALKYQESREKTENESKIYNSAVNEFLDFEKGVKAKYSDYEDVSKFYSKNLEMGLRTMYPMAEEDQIKKMALERVLMTASQYAKLGVNPVEAMYNDAKTKLGYVAVKKNEDPKPSIKDISKNKERSVSSIVSSSQGGGTPLTKEKVMGMSVAEWSHLNSDELKRLEQMG